MEGKGQQQAGCISQGTGKGKGGGWQPTGGGEGKGGRNRVPGTKAFLKNHRKMLTHMTDAAAIDLCQAVSAHGLAEEAYAAAKSPVIMKALYEASEWVKNRELNVSWIDFKFRSLDDDGVYIITNGSHIVHLADDEKWWNLELRREQARIATAAASASNEEANTPPAGFPAASSSSPPAPAAHLPPPFNVYVSAASAGPPAASLARPATTELEVRAPDKAQPFPSASLPPWRNEPAASAGPPAASLARPPTTEADVRASDNAQPFSPASLSLLPWRNPAANLDPPTATHGHADF